MSEPGRQSEIANVIGQLFTPDHRADDDADRVAKTLERIARRAGAGELDATEAAALVEVQRDQVIVAALRVTGETSISRQNQINEMIDLFKSLVMSAAKAAL